MSIRFIVACVGALCAAPLCGLAAQQGPDSTSVATPAVQAPAPIATSTGSSLTGPRRVAVAARADLSPAPSRTAERAYVQEGGRHTITVSTLALVLGVIILVLLIAR